MKRVLFSLMLAVFAFLAWSPQVFAQVPEFHYPSYADASVAGVRVPCAFCHNVPFVYPRPVPLCNGMSHNGYCDQPCCVETCTGRVMNYSVNYFYETSNFHQDNLWYYDPNSIGDRPTNAQILGGVPRFVVREVAFSHTPVAGDDGYACQHPSTLNVGSLVSIYLEI
jgi:hypothetical protein